MSESRGSPAFLVGTNTNRDCESLLLESKSNKKEKDSRVVSGYTTPPGLREYKRKMIISDRLGFTPPHGTYVPEDLERYALKSINFDQFPHASPIDAIMESAKNEPTPVPRPASWYTSQSGLTPSAGIESFHTERTRRAKESTFALAMFDHIFNVIAWFDPSCHSSHVCAPPRINKRRERYTPQMGEVSETCQAATKAAANTCYQELAKWPIFDISVAKAQLSKMSSYLEKECDFVAIIFVCSLSYIAYRILSNLALLGTWMFGYATCAIGTRQHQQLYTSKYSPQVGMLSSDDGAAFTGVKPKKATAASKTPKKVVPSAQSTPGVTMLQKSYSSSFGGAPRSKKDPRLQDGPLNGFGVGI